jgi:hypothetical protein
MGQRPTPPRRRRGIVFGMSELVAWGRSGRERRQRACEAALAVSSRLGINAERAGILEDWNYTIVRLVPTPIVAKVQTSHFRDARLESLDREVRVAAHLAQRGAPVVPPAPDVPLRPHRWRELKLTLWRYVEPVSGATPSPAETAAALKVVHEALNDFEEPLPSFMTELTDARMLLQPDRSPALEPADRRFLAGVATELQAALATLEGEWRALHGSPHQANWLPSADGLLLLDFETACRGPLEWDLAALADEALALFFDVDRDLILTMRRMRSVCVAAKCWVAPERAPEVREAAHVHLKLLRGEEPDWPSVLAARTGRGRTRIRGRRDVIARGRMLVDERERRPRWAPTRSAHVAMQSVERSPQRHAECRAGITHAGTGRIPVGWRNRARAAERGLPYCSVSGTRIALSRRVRPSSAN